jgi:hypothetical protein
VIRRRSTTLAAGGSHIQAVIVDRSHCPPACASRRADAWLCVSRLVADWGVHAGTWALREWGALAHRAPMSAVALMSGPGCSRKARSREEGPEVCEDRVPIALKRDRHLPARTPSPTVALLPPGSRATATMRLVPVMWMWRSDDQGFRLAEPRSREQNAHCAAVAALFVGAEVLLPCLRSSVRRESGLRRGSPGRCGKFLSAISLPTFEVAMGDS